MIGWDDPLVLVLACFLPVFLRRGESVSWWGDRAGRSGSACCIQSLPSCTGAMELHSLNLSLPCVTAAKDTVEHHSGVQTFKLLSLNQDRRSAARLLSRSRSLHYLTLADAEVSPHIGHSSDDVP